MQLAHKSLQKTSEDKKDIGENPQFDSLARNGSGGKRVARAARVPPSANEP